MIDLDLIPCRTEIPKRTNEEEKKIPTTAYKLYRSVIGLATRTRRQTEFLRRSFMYIYDIVFFLFHFACTTPEYWFGAVACAYEWIRTTANLWTIYCNSTLAHTCRRYHRLCIVLRASFRIHSLCVSECACLPFFECALALSYYIVSVIGCALVTFIRFVWSVKRTEQRIAMRDVRCVNTEHCVCVFFFLLSFSRTFVRVSRIEESTSTASHCCSHLVCFQHLR